MAVANSSNISTIQILRSYANSSPSTLADGQLAFSFVSNTLFIGSNTGGVIAISDQATANLAKQLANNTLHLTGYTSQTVNGNVIIQGSITLLDGSQIKDSNSVYSTTTANQTLDIFSSTQFRTAKYLIQATANTDVHVTEVLITHNDTNVYLTEYGTTYSNTLITIDSTIGGGLVTLIVTPIYSATTIDLIRTSLISRTLGGGGDIGLFGDLNTQSGTEDLNIDTGSTDLNI